MILPLLFFGINKVHAQFNTVSYQNKIASVDVSDFSENSFQGTFISYHLEGKSNKKRIKEEKIKAKAEKEKAEKEIVAPVVNTEKPLSETIEKKDLEKKTVYKKLDLINEDNYAFEEKQTIYMPLNNIKITSDYGSRFHPIDKVYKAHNGVDLRADNDYVFSVLDGVVSDAGYESGGGNYIKIKHGDFETIYLHLEKFFYVRGDIIRAGDIIAVSGNTGKSTAPHLHFAVKDNGVFIDPIEFLNDLIQTNNALSDFNN